MTLSLSAPVVVELLRGERRHYRRFLEEALEQGEEARICSLVLHQLSHAALKSATPEPHLDKLAALVGYVDVEPWTGEDAMAAARLQAEWERTIVSSARSPVGLLDVLTAGQAQNRGWTLVVAQPIYGLGAGETILWGDPEGPVDPRYQTGRFIRTP